MIYETGNRSIPAKMPSGGFLLISVDFLSGTVESAIDLLDLNDVIHRVLTIGKDRHAFELLHESAESRVTHDINVERRRPRGD
jgi:hypothetical protein